MTFPPCNGPSLLYLVFSHILCSSVLALFRISLLTLYLKNSFRQCLQIQHKLVIIHKTRSKFHKMLLPRTGQVIRHTLLVQHMLFLVSQPHPRQVLNIAYLQKQNKFIIFAAALRQTTIFEGMKTAVDAVSELVLQNWSVSLPCDLL